MKIHPSVTLLRVQEAAEEEAYGQGHPGFCVECGAEAEGVEPDAERYRCEECKKPAVYGAAQLLLMMSGW